MTNIDTLLEKPDTMKAWINHKATQQFFVYLKLEREVAVRHLRDAKGLQAIGEAQGDLRRIDKILSLTDVINDRNQSKYDGV